jgi:hypothetical protein
MWPALAFAVLCLADCAPSSDFATLAGGASFNAQDCGGSPISGLPFQQCMVSPWIEGSGHASSGGFTAWPQGIRPGSEGGLINSQKIYAASYSDNRGTVLVQYAIPYGAFDDFYEIPPLNDASRVGPQCQSILDRPCPAGNPISDLRVRSMTLNGKLVRLEEFTILDNPRFRSGFVAYIPGDPAPGRPGYASSTVVRGYLTQPAGAAGDVAAAFLTPLRFQRFQALSQVDRGGSGRSRHLGPAPSRLVQCAATALN